MLNLTRAATALGAVTLTVCAVMAGLLTERTSAGVSDTPKAAVAAQAQSSNEASSSPAPASTFTSVPVGNPSQKAVATSDDVDMTLVKDYPTPAERKFWTRAIKKIWLRPPCCGACSVVSQDDFRVLAKVMSNNSSETPANREIWDRYKGALLVSVKNQDPVLYQELQELKRKN